MILHALEIGCNAGTNDSLHSEFRIHICLCLHQTTKILTRKNWKQNTGRRIKVSRDVTPCRLVNSYWNFDEFCVFIFRFKQSFKRNISDWLIPEDMNFHQHRSENLEVAEYRNNSGHNFASPEGILKHTTSYKGCDLLYYDQKRRLSHQLTLLWTQFCVSGRNFKTHNPL
jgi:hypothetical protein